MNPDVVCYIAQVVAAVLFVVLAEFGLKRRYEPDHTVWMAALGIAEVGLIVAGRLAWAPLPALAGPALAWWVWWLTFWSFVAAALPIVAWQLVLQRIKLAEFVAYVRGGK